MSDRRRDGNGSDPPLIDPTANVIALQKASDKRQDDLRRAETRRLNERDRMREVHRLELAAKDAEIARKESQRIDAVAAVEKARVDSQFLEQKSATALATTASDLKATALADRVSTTATAVASQTSASTARSDLSTPLLLTLATLGGGLVIYLIQQALK